MEKKDKKSVFPVSVKDEEDFILFKLYQHKCEEKVWDEYLELSKELNKDRRPMHLTKKEVEVRGFFEQCYRGALCISNLLPIEIWREGGGYKKRFDVMYDFRLYIAGKSSYRNKRLKIDKEVVVTLINGGYLKYSGGGQNLMAKKRVYDQSWTLSEKGKRYCKKRGFDKLIK